MQGSEGGGGCGPAQAGWGGPSRVGLPEGAHGMGLGRFFCRGSKGRWNPVPPLLPLCLSQLTAALRGLSPLPLVQTPTGVLGGDSLTTPQAAESPGPRALN